MLLRDALRFSVDVLSSRSDPTQLCVQLVGRLLPAVLSGLEERCAAYIKGNCTIIPHAARELGRRELGEKGNCHDNMFLHHAVFYIHLSL